MIVNCCHNTHTHNNNTRAGLNVQIIINDITPISTPRSRRGWTMCFAVDEWVPAAWPSPPPLLAFCTTQYMTD